MKPHDYWTCAEALSRLDDYLDRELEDAELDGIRQHLEVCEVCAREFRFEASVLREVRAKLTRIALPVGFEGDVWRALKRAAAERDSSVS